MRIVTNIARRLLHPAITVTPNIPITKAHELMAHENINQCHAVKNCKHVGLIIEKDVLKAYPSSATTLAVWEITSPLEKIKVEDVMIKEFQNANSGRNPVPVQLHSYVANEAGWARLLSECGGLNLR